jgi:hypothetical protein
MIFGPKTELLIAKLDDVGIGRDEAISWLEEVLCEQTAIATHYCTCHAKTQGPCGVCTQMGCQVWDFNQVAMPKMG